jgi:hypothetical protein
MLSNLRIDKLKLIKGYNGKYVLCKKAGFGEFQRYMEWLDGSPYRWIECYLFTDKITEVNIEVIEKALGIRFKRK